MNWWTEESPVRDKIGIIADGSIRAGKTVPMSISFVEWAMDQFDGQNFAFCGKTISSIRRNVIRWLLPLLRVSGYKVDEKRTENLIVITGYGKQNTFYLFGGKDEQSQDLIQGVTLAGVLFDEVALMPESFVNQATGRCSVEGAKYWFNCNPDSPSHWFKLNWIDQKDSKNVIHLHFTMDDNPSLSPERKRVLSSIYTGIFYKRFILGLWVVAEGAIYDMWEDEKNIYDEVSSYILRTSRRYVSVDYGTQNAMVFLDILDTGTEILVNREYYYSGRETGIQKTDYQYGIDFDKFVGDIEIDRVIIDPSAASFIAELKNRGYRVKEADNEVLDGIKMVSTFLGKGLLKFHRSCVRSIREMQSYVWDTKLTDKGKEQPVKKNDHAPDNIRYFIKTMIKPRRLVA